ncbi:MAG: HAMP domain-containing histidine kinase [Clostridia bacterium]|nr:HAMP domain-containing histidine kinase [Clostridia bacterium]
MRKSVMKSMILCSLTVMFVSFLIVTGIFLYNIRDDLMKDTYKEMDVNIDKVKPVVSVSMDYSTGKMFDFFDISMHQLTDAHKYNIIICSTDGEIIWGSGGNNHSHLKPYAEKAIISIGNKEKIHVSKLMNGLYGTETLTSVHKVYNYTYEKSCLIICTVCAPSIMSHFVGILSEVMLMELIALAFTALFLFLFSKNITTPLKKINNAVGEFTKGNFDKRVEYSSHNELGELADNINMMASSIQNLEKMRIGFVSDVSHELRTPMTTISGFVEGMLDGTIPDKDKQKYLGIVLTETKRLSRLVNDLLDVSRFDEGKQVLKKTDFDVCELAKIVILKFEREINAKKLDIVFESDNDETFVNADKDNITRVLINLIHNAVKFSNKNGYIKIRIYESNEKCNVEIENSGSGISEEKLDFIWERFYKTDDSRSSDKSGVGLGLYIVKRIIDAHNEKIKVISIPDNYTRFTFTLDCSCI